MTSSGMGVFLYVEMFLMGVSYHAHVLILGDSADMRSARYAVQNVSALAVVIPDDEQSDRASVSVADFHDVAGEDFSLVLVEKPDPLVNFTIGAVEGFDLSVENGIDVFIIESDGGENFAAHVVKHPEFDGILRLMNVLEIHILAPCSECHGRGQRRRRKPVDCVFH